MNGSQSFSVSPQVLVWAREQRGLDVSVAAKRLQIAEASLAAIEAGEKQPSLSLLRRMADYYKRPLIVLLLDEPPTTFTPLQDFRRLPEAEAGHYSPQLHDELRRAVEEQEIFAELRTQLGQPIGRPQLPSSRDPLRLAHGLTTLLSVGDSERRAWRDSRTALSQWRSRVEALDVLVLETSRVKTSEMRGFSLSEREPLVIVLNGEDSERGKIFTLLHELAHLCRREPGVCDLHNRGSRSDDVEVFCNAVAGEALLPQQWLARQPVFARHNAQEPWTDREVESLSRDSGGASREVILRRLRDLQLVSQAEYETRRGQLAEEYERFRGERRAKSKGGPQPYVMQLRDRGRPFVRSVFDAYADGHVNLSQVVDLVGVRTKHLERLQSEAFK
jgi:Zn-dependent peptidase ImmA (M78 family)/transcriptional regulator with XRE-family HTH domain